MPFVQNDKIKLFYHVEGDGHPIILINDLLEDHLFWNKIVQNLSKDFKVITFDQRGMGQSSISKSSFTMEDLALDVMVIADELKLETFSIIGDSMGGAVAQIVAKQYPDRIHKLILSNSYLQLSKVVKWSLEIACEYFKEDSSYVSLYKFMMPWHYSSRFLERENDAEEILSALKSRKHPLQYEGLKRLLDAIFEFDSHLLIKHIQTRTLVIIGEEDIYCLFRDSRELVRSLPNHQVELISGGHATKIEHPNYFLEAVRKFLSAN